MRKRVRSLIACLGFAVFIFAPDPALSRPLDFWLQGTTLKQDDFPGRIRQLGMAGLWIAVPDEDNELNLYDFSRNIAWLPFDKDSTYTDNDYIHYSRKSDRGGWDRDDMSLSRTRGIFYKIDSGVKSTGGGLTVYSLYREIGLSDTSKTSFQILAPTVEVSLARALSPFVTVGARAVVSSESGPKNASGVYVVNQTSSAYGGGGAVAITGLGGLALGATVDFARTGVTSSTKSNFHDDNYKYTAPSFDASFQGAVEAGETGRGVIDFRYSSQNGSETARINWSDRFPLNPIPTNLVLNYSTHSDEYRARELRTRWVVNIAPLGASLGTFFSAYEKKYWLKPEVGRMGIVFSKDLTIGTLINRNDVSTGFSTGGGLVFRIPGKRGLFGGDLEYSRSDEETLLTARSWTTPADNMTIRSGCEVKVSSNAFLRAGFAWEKLNPDRNVSGDELTSTELTAGVGIVPPGKDFSLDFAYSLKGWKGNSLDRAGEERNLNTYSLFCRFLF